MGLKSSEATSEPADFTSESALARLPRKQRPRPGRAALPAARGLPEPVAVATVPGRGLGGPVPALSAPSPWKEGVGGACLRLLLLFHPESPGAAPSSLGGPRGQMRREGWEGKQREGKEKIHTGTQGKESQSLISLKLPRSGTPGPT